MPMCYVSYVDCKLLRTRKTRSATGGSAAGAWNFSGLRVPNNHQPVSPSSLSPCYVFCWSTQEVGQGVPQDQVVVEEGDRHLGHHDRTGGEAS